MCWTNRIKWHALYDQCSQISTPRTWNRWKKENQKYGLLTSTLRHSWLADPARGHELHSRKSCCLKVPSSLALHTTLGLPTSTYIWQTNENINNRTMQRLTKAKNVSAWMSKIISRHEISCNTSMYKYIDMENTSQMTRLMMLSVLLKIFFNLLKFMSN